MNGGHSKLGHLFAALTSAALLTACGGGGSTAAQGPTPAPAAALSVPSLTFASTVVGSFSANREVTLSNSGSAALSLSAITSNDAAFTITGGTCVGRALVPAGSACTVDIAFSPTTPGAASASLIFSHNAAPATSTVSLGGYATAAELPPGALPVVTAADCPRLLSQSQAVASLVIQGADMQQVVDILQATSPNHGYQLFARMPGTLMWWVRTQGGAIDMQSIGAAVHETNHAFDSAMHGVCRSDNRARLLLDSVVNQTDLVNGSTANYSIAGETVPASLQTGLRFAAYITAAASVSGNDFAIMLDELNAYTGGAEFEIGLLSNAAYSPLTDVGDFNAGGQVDFMLYTLAYLKAARLNHPTTYANIQSQANTISYIQTVWARAEANLVALYPYTALAGTGGMVVSKESLATTYSPDFIGELDRLGVTHQPLNAWAATYLH